MRREFYDVVSACRPVLDGKGFELLGDELALCRHWGEARTNVPGEWVKPFVCVRPEDSRKATPRSNVQPDVVRLCRVAEHAAWWQRREFDRFVIAECRDAETRQALSGITQR